MLRGIRMPCELPMRRMGWIIIYGKMLLQRYNIFELIVSILCFFHKNTSKSRAHFQFRDVCTIPEVTTGRRGKA